MVQINNWRRTDGVPIEDERKGEGKYAAYTQPGNITNRRTIWENITGNKL